MRLSTKAALFHRYFPTQNNREVTKNIAVLSTKMPRSVPGLIVRVHTRRAAFRRVSGFKKGPLCARMKKNVYVENKSSSRSLSSRPILQTFLALRNFSGTESTPCRPSSTQAPLALCVFHFHHTGPQPFTSTRMCSPSPSHLVSSTNTPVRFMHVCARPLTLALLQTLTQ